MILNVQLSNRYMKYYQQGLFFDYLLKSVLQKTLLSLFNSILYNIFEKVFFNGFLSWYASSPSITYILNTSSLNNWFLTILPFFNLTLIYILFNPALFSK